MPGGHVGFVDPDDADIQLRKAAGHLPGVFPRPVVDDQEVPDAKRRVMLEKIRQNGILVANHGRTQQIDLPEVARGPAHRMIRGRQGQPPPGGECNIGVLRRHGLSAQVIAKLQAQARAGIAIQRMAMKLFDLPPRCEMDGQPREGVKLPVFASGQIGAQQRPAAGVPLLPFGQAASGDDFLRVKVLIGRALGCASQVKGLPDKHVGLVGRPEPQQAQCLRSGIDRLAKAQSQFPRRPAAGEVRICLQHLQRRPRVTAGKVQTKLRPGDLGIGGAEPGGQPHGGAGGVQITRGQRNARQQQVFEGRQAGTRCEKPPRDPQRLPGLALPHQGASAFSQRRAVAGLEREAALGGGKRGLPVGQDMPAARQCQMIRSLAGPGRHCRRGLQPGSGGGGVAEFEIASGQQIEPARLDGARSRVEGHGEQVPGVRPPTEFRQLLGCRDLAARHFCADKSRQVCRTIAGKPVAQGLHREWRVVAGALQHLARLLPASAPRKATGNGGGAMALANRGQLVQARLNLTRVKQPHDFQRLPPAGLGRDLAGCRGLVGNVHQSVPANRWRDVK